MAGVWAYFYNYDHWHDLYAKNCSSKISAEWYAVGHANVPLGLLNATFGIFCEVTVVIPVQGWGTDGPNKKGSVIYFQKIRRGSLLLHF